jgi:hypothetical protein
LPARWRLDTRGSDICRALRALKSFYEGKGAESATTKRSKTLLGLAANHTLALFGGHHVDIARYIGHLLAPAFGAFRFFSFVLRDGLGTFKLLTAFLATILVSRHGLVSIDQGGSECHFTAGG